MITCSRCGVFISYDNWAASIPPVCEMCRGGGYVRPAVYVGGTQTFSPPCEKCTTLEAEVERLREANARALDRLYATSCGHQWSIRHTACPDCFAEMKTELAALRARACGTCKQQHYPNPNGPFCRILHCRCADAGFTCGAWAAKETP